MSSFSRQLLVCLVLIAAGFAGVFSLSNFVEKNRVSAPESYSDEDLAFQGKRLKGYALGSEGMLADWYWMRSLQYIGDKIVAAKLENINLDDLTPLNPRLLYPLLDNATDLDPHLIAAYSYGATVLPAIDPQQAIRLSEKGIAENPNEWRLLQYLGYIYWKLGDYDKAAEVYERGSRVANAPKFFSMMVAKMRADAGSRDTARRMYEQMATESTDEQTKSVGEMRLKQMDALDELDAINAALEEFRGRNGRCVSALSEIIPSLRSVELPDGKDFRVDASRKLVDPTGVPYFLKTPECKAVIDNTKSKIPAN